MRIGLIGWYGHSNAGDERILYCLQRFFKGHELVVTRGFNDAAARLEELNTCDFVILGGGGLILRGTGKFAELIKKIKVRFGCVGISVEACHQDNRQLIEALKEFSEFILVRDERSRQLFNGHFKTIVGPDLTFLYPYEVIQPAQNNTCGINLRPWHFWDAEHNSLFDRIMHKIHRDFPSFANYYPRAKWEPDRCLSLLKKHFDEIIPVCLYAEAGTENDHTLLTKLLPEVSPDFSIESYSRISFLIAMRLHALIFSCQCGVPFLSLTYQPKNSEFCKSLGLHEISVDLFDPMSLEAAIDYIKYNHSAIRAKLIEARDHNCQEINNIMTSIRNLITN